MQQNTLRETRAAKRLTQVELAEKSGLRQNTISALERGAIKKPSYDTVAKLAKALKVRPEELGFGAAA